MENTLGHHHGTIVDAQDLPLDDGRESELQNLVDGDLYLVEHLGDDGHGAVGSLADSEGEVAR